ncbi:hypothetical protein JTB14_036813 [Gonioctena quinquepunctata]|nr:hypothetical protein JTB14_036813 [Gonioctena quinquepunctata]
MDDAEARDLIVPCVADSVLELIKTKKTAKAFMDTLQTTFSRIAGELGYPDTIRDVKGITFHTEDGIWDLRYGKVEGERALMPNEYQCIFTTIDILLTSNPGVVNEDFEESKLLSEKESVKKSKKVESNDQGDAFIRFLTIVRLEIRFRKLVDL